MNKIILFIIKICVLLLLLNLYIFAHETTHVQIFKYYGCDSEIKMFDFKQPGMLWFYTLPNKDCNFTGDVVLAQSIVEAISYPLFFIFSILIIVIIFWRNE